jgi:phosphomannomutase
MDDYQSLHNGSDVRGIAMPGVEGEKVNLTPERANRIAQAFAAWLSKKAGKPVSDLVVAVGHDPRLTGVNLMGSVEEGLIPLGVRVLDCGLATTPAMFMTTVFGDYAADGACMVTASHLPWNRNGLKFFSRDGGLESADIVGILDDAASDEALAAIPHSPAVPLEHRDLLGAYSAHLRGLICDALGGDAPLDGLSVCVDAGNGSGGFFATQVLEPLGADISASQFLEPDGKFPNHPANPENAEAMASICAAVKKAGCDLGVIFDADVDRSSAVDEHGREINRNAIVALAAALVAEDHPATTVVTDSVTSNELTEFLEGKLGLNHLRYKRGYRNVIDKMGELNAQGVDCALAIETSGHAAYLDNYSLDDGTYLACRIVIKAAKLKREGKGISDLLADLKMPAESVEVRMPVTDPDVAATGKRILADLEAWAEGAGQEAAQAEGCSLEVVKPNYEGVRIAVSGKVNGWFLLRSSLHEPLMPLNVESEQDGGTDVIRGLLRLFMAGEEGIDASKL